MSDEQDADSGHLRRNYGKEKNNYPGCNHCSDWSSWRNRLYYRDNVIDVATEAFDVVAEKIPFLQSGKSDDKVYVEKVSKIMNTYTGNTNRYNGVVESQDSYEVNVDSSRTIKEILVKVGVR